MKGLQVDWYAARSAGVIAYVLLTGGVLLGTTLSARARLPRWPAFAVTDVHRFVAILVGVFVSIHVAAIWLDSFTPFSVAQLLVPGAATYRPLWVALGIVSAELLLAIAVSNALKKRLGHKLWRRVHYLTFAVWAGATAHGLGAGTDASTPWLRFVYVASIAAVLAAVVWRVARSVLPRADVEGAVAAAAVFAFALVLGLGKLPHAIGGTGTARASTARAATALPGAVSDAFAGSVQQQNGAGGALVSIVGSGTGGRALRLRLDVVTPDGQTMTDTSLQVQDVKTGQVCTGSITNVSGTGFVGTCGFPGGATRTVTGTWQLTQQSAVGRVRLSA